MDNCCVPDFIDHLDSIGERHLIGVDGHMTSWRSFGAGAPLVLVHGGHGSWLHWARNIETLAATRLVLVPDLPGYGSSDGLSAGGTFSDLVDRMAAAVDTLLGPGTRFGLAGFSFGGVVAGCLALRRGGVDRLALLGAVGHGLRRRQTAAMQGWRDAGDEPALLAAMRHNLGVLMLHGPVDSLALEIHRRSCLQTRFQSKKTSLSPILTHTLERLEIPVLAMWGEHDPTGDPAEVGRSWCATGTGRTCEVVAGAGHWVQYEAAGQVNRRLLDWFGER